MGTISHGLIQHARESLRFRSTHHLSALLDSAEAFLERRRFLALSAQTPGVPDSAGAVRGGDQQTNSRVSLFVFPVIAC